MTGAPRTHRILLTAVLLGAAISPVLAQPAADEISVVLGEKTRDREGVASLLREARDALAALEESSLSPEARARVREAQEAQIGALEELLRAIDEIRGISDRRAALKRDIDLGRRDLTAARLRAEKPEVPETLSEQQLTAYVSAAERAKEAVRRTEEDLRVTTAAAAARQSRFDGTSAALTVLQQEREKLRAAAEREDQPPAERAAATTRLGANEARQRFLELGRTHHAALAELDGQTRELARVRIDLATATAALAEAELSVARGSRERQLEQERQRAEEEAERQKARAERLRNLPAARAVASLQALVEDFRGRSAQEAQTESRLQEIERGLELEKERIEKRNEAIRERIPAGSDLDGLRRSYLIEQRRRLASRLDEIRTRRETLADDMPRIQRDAVRERDRIAALRDRVADEELRRSLARRGRPSTTSGIDIERLDEYQARWLGAVVDLEAGMEDLREEAAATTRVELRTAWDQASQELDRLIAERLRRLETIEKGTAAALRLVGRAASLLEERRAHLDEVSFWLREEPPLGAASRARAWEDARRFAERAPAVPGTTWSRLRARGFGLLDAIGAALLLAAIPAAWLTRRRLVAPPPAAAAPDDPLPKLRRSTVWVFLRAFPALLALGGLAFLVRSLRPADPLLASLLALAVVAAAYRLFTGITEALVASAPEGDIGADLRLTARRARRIGRFGALGVALLLPAALGIERLGLPDLAALGRIALSLWGWSIAAWLVVRRDVLLLYVPVEKGSGLSRGLRDLIRVGWPALTLFLLVVGILDLLGYENASQALAARSLLCVAVLAAANVVYQVLRAVIAGRVRPPEADREDVAPDADPDLRQLVRQLLNGLLLLTTLAGTIAGLSAALGITAERWRQWGSVEIVGGPPGQAGTALGDFLFAIVFLGGAIVAGGFLRRAMQYGLRRADVLTQGSRFALSTLSFYAILAIGTLLSLRALGIFLGELTWLLAPAGVAIGFGLTQIFSNFVSGLILFFERPVQVGDIITVGAVEGDVKRISIRSTVVRTRDGVSIILPNRKLIEEEVVNWSHADPKTRLRLSVGVAYGSDVPLVKKTLLEVAEREGRVLRRPRPEVSFLEFGDSQLSFEMLVWLASPDLTFKRRVRSDLNSAIDAAFARAGITIPFPQRDMHVRSMPAEDAVVEDAPAEEQPSAERKLP